MEVSISLIIIGLIITIVILINPFFGLLITIAIIPQSLFQAVSGSILGIFTAATPIKIIGGITFVSVFIRHILERKSWSFLRKPQIIFIIIFLLWVYISGFGFPGFATRENFTVFTSVVILGFIILSLINNLQRLKKVIWTILLSFGFVSFNSILHHSSLSGIARAEGTSYGPNEFAIALLPILGIAFYNIFGEKLKIAKFFSLLITTIIGITLIFTLSRGGFIGFTAMLLAIFFTAKRKIKSLLFLTIAITLILSFLPVEMWYRLQATQTTMQNFDETSSIDSTKIRILAARAAWKIFLDHPFLGVGIGNYYYEGRKYEPMRPLRAHTMYLEIMAELGIVGLLLFLGIIFYTFKSLNRIIKNETFLSSYAKGPFIGLIGFLVAAIFLHAQQEKALWFVIFMSVALENIVLKEQRSANKKIPKKAYEK